MARRGDERTPVLIGVGAADQRVDDERSLTDPATADVVELMRRATDTAIADAGVPAVRERIGWIGVPEGTWRHGDPGRSLAELLGVPDPAGVLSVVADVGILQQDLIDAACLAVLDEGVDVALVVGGEAKHRASRARQLGVELVETIDPDARPDVRIRPSSLGVTDLEIIRNIVTPAVAYALIESARAHTAARSMAERRDRIASRWAAFAEVARSNPRAWDRRGHSAREIREPDPPNRMLAFPYTRLMCSQWNVDQAAALLVCSLATARSLGVARDTMVFPVVTAVANDAVPVSQRSAVGRSVGAELCGAVLRERPGGMDPVAHLDLYSCFPSAVDVYAEALGVADRGDTDLTVTGGMAFAGGPLNNYVLQAMVELVQRARQAPAELVLSSSVSGFLMKQGLSLWQAAPPSSPWTVVDVTERARVRTDTVPVVERPGPARIAAWTVDSSVVDADGRPHHRAVALVDFVDGSRTIVSTDEHDVVAELVASDDAIGRSVQVLDGGAAELI